MLKILALVALVAAVGCSKDDSNSKNDTAGSAQSGAGSQAATQAVHDHQTDFPARTGSIYGGWAAPDQSDNGQTFKFDIFVREATMGVLVTCVASNGAVATSYLEANIALTDSTITVDQDYEQTNEENGINCTASLKAGTLSYSIANDFLNINGANLTRAY